MSRGPFIDEARRCPHGQRYDDQCDKCDADEQEPVMSDDIQQAAERLERTYADGNWWDIYGGDRNSERDRREAYVMQDQDYRTLAGAHLAHLSAAREQQERDEQPVTANGDATLKMEYSSLHVRWTPATLTVRCSDRFGGKTSIVKQQPTQGDVRKLCEVLRIPLNEDV